MRNLARNTQLSLTGMAWVSKNVKSALSITAALSAGGKKKKRRCGVSFFAIFMNLFRHRGAHADADVDQNALGGDVGRGHQQVQAVHSGGG